MAGPLAKLGASAWEPGPTHDNDIPLTEPYYLSMDFDVLHILMGRSSSATLDFGKKKL